MTATTTSLEQPKELVGVWKADALHSSVRFAIRHVVSTFHGFLGDFDAELLVSPGRVELVGRGQVASLTTQDDALDEHLFSAEFFDLERYPEITLSASSFELSGNQVTIEGDLTIKGTTRTVPLEGTVAGPAADPFGGTRLGLVLTTVLDRSDFGIGWNMPLPGGDLYLGEKVELAAELELVKEV